MPATLVVVGLALYLLRRRRPVAALWGVVDRSIGMWIVRRLTGRPDPVAARPRSDGEAPTEARLAADEIAYRIGVPGANAPNRPDRLVVSGDANHDGARRVLWRDSAVALVAVSAVVLIAVVVLPGLPQGAVLTATDDGRFPAEVTLPPSPGSTDTAAASATPTTGPTDDATEPPEASPTSSPTAEPSASPTPPGPTGTPIPTASVAAATASPSVTPRPTPVPTAPPPPPPPTPTPPPPVATPSPTPAPPIAVLSCSVSGFVVSCTGSSSPNATSWTWTFQQGPVLSGPSVSHTYTQAGDYLVTLTVANSAGQTDSQSTVVGVQ